MDLSESKDFLVHTASLKEVRVFSREVFEKLKIKNDLKEELVLAIAEAAQNIVKHAYKGVENTADHMQIKISLKDNKKGVDKSYEMNAENILQEATISGYKIISKKVLKEKNGWRTMVLLEYSLI